MRMLALVLVFIFGATWMKADVSVKSHQIEGAEEEFVPNSMEEEHILACLRSRLHARRARHDCEMIYSAVREMSAYSARSRRRRDITQLEQEYATKIVAMKNHNMRARKDALKMAAPCAKFSSSTREKWINFFDIRTGVSNVEGRTFFPVDQKILDNELEITMDPPSGNTSQYLLHDLLAVDLALFRAPPCQLNEYYGEYSLVVRKFLNVSQTFETVVHSSKQASCPTVDGYMIVLSLDRDELSRWFFENSQQLKLRVQALPLRQFFADSSARDLSNIIRRGLSLTFHLRVGVGAKQVHQLDLKDLLPAYASSIADTRQKRSLNVSSELSGCKRMKYPPKLRLGQTSQLVIPSWHEIGECSGRCDYAMSSSMNATNHSVLMKLEEMKNSAHPVPPTVDCVPLAYSNLHYLYTSTMSDGFVENFIVDYCGCR